MDSMEKANRAEEIILDALGAETFLDELTRALTVDQKLDLFDYIARNHDLDQARELLES